MLSESRLNHELRQLETRMAVQLLLGKPFPESAETVGVKITEHPAYVRNEAIRTALLDVLERKDIPFDVVLRQAKWLSV